MGLANAILDQAIRRLNELSTTAPVRWTRPELMVFFNDGLAELNLIATDFQETHNLSIDNTASVWNLSVDVIAPLSVYLDGKYLLRESVENLDKEFDWEDPIFVRKDPKLWASLGSNKIIIIPRSQTTKVVQIETLSQYDPVTDIAVDMILWIRPEYELAIEDYVVSRAIFKEGGAEFQQGVMFYNRFLDTVQQLSSRNIIRQYPQWDVGETRVSETTLREAVENRNGTR